MRSKTLFFSLLLAVLSSLGNGLTANAAANFDHIRGRIVIQTEDHGEAWYVLPTETTRFYIKNGEAAYTAMRNFGLGISNADLKQIPVGVQNLTNADESTTDTDQDGLADKLEEALGTNPEKTDSDNDGYGDLAELNGGYDPLSSGKLPINTSFTNGLKGYVLLQVESHGEAWYVNPTDGKRYYMANGDWAYEIMRSMSLGITNNDLSYVPIYAGTLNCGESIDCVIGSIEAFTDATAVIKSDVSLFGKHIESWSRLEYDSTRGTDARYSWTWTTLRQLVDGVEQPDMVGVGQRCRSVHYTDLIDILKEAKLGNYTTETPDTVLCEVFGDK